MNKTQPFLSPSLPHPLPEPLHLSRTRIPPRSRHFRETLVGAPRHTRMQLTWLPSVKGRSGVRVKSCPESAQSWAFKEACQRTKDEITKRQGTPKDLKNVPPRFLLTCRQVFLNEPPLLAGWGLASYPGLPCVPGFGFCLSA